MSKPTNLVKGYLEPTNLKFIKGYVEVANGSTSISGAINEAVRNLKACQPPEALAKIMAAGGNIKK